MHESSVGAPLNRSWCELDAARGFEAVAASRKPRGPANRINKSLLPSMTLRLPSTIVVIEQPDMDVAEPPGPSAVPVANTTHRGRPSASDGNSYGGSVRRDT